jgi:hypothetical protein
MGVVYSRCAGLDVHKKTVSVVSACIVCAKPKEPSGNRRGSSGRSLAICWRWQTG